MPPQLFSSHPFFAPSRLLIVLVVFACGPALGQGSVVEPGPNFTLRVDGQPFYPLGWNMVGSCTPYDAPPGTDHRTEIAREVEQLRSFGVNALFEAPFTYGRLIPLRSDPSWHNWYNYRFEVEGRERETGHARPGVYVEAMRWLMDRAADAAQPANRIYTFASLGSFVTPGLANTPYGGSDLLDCAAYRAFIEEERSHVAATDPARAARIPAVSCDGQSPRPFWEWNVWYVVRGLRDHPGLLGWYLEDEPEGIRLQYAYGIVQPDEPIRPFSGPGSFPTPDLLRYTYDLVKRYETEGREADYQRHPILVDIYLPDVFFSRRFTWSRDGSLNPDWHSGPFDRTPAGEYATPADLLGLDASNQVHNPKAAEGGGRTLPDLGWWADQNLTSQRAAALREVAERDRLWSSLVIQGQAQLSGAGPFAIREPLRCGENLGQLRSRLLNDRDLVWGLLTLQVDGLRGYLYYSHNLLPTQGPGAEMERRVNRLLAQFRQAEFDGIFMTPRVTQGWAVTGITVHALTNYFRSVPGFVGPAADYDPGRSSFAPPRSRLAPDAYTPLSFGRSDDPDHYGEAVSPPPAPPGYPNHRLLRTALHHYDDAAYLLVSNIYDARITADLTFELPPNGRVEEGLFDLDRTEGFSWYPHPHRLDVQSGEGPTSWQVALEPYEVRVFRWPLVGR